ncbi:hypothetical protein F4808DRAFT_466156 [Astrocystis sublimbata]|nr:hypothetical protein F4808DRAFT_466156 [Astrocystis sublimbata]
MPQLENWAEQRLQSSASSHLRSYKNKAPNESRAPIRPALRTQERTKDVSLRRQRRVSMNEQGKDPDITLISSAKPHYVSPQVSRPVPEGSTTLVDPVAVGKQGPLGQAQTGANSEITEWVSPENRPIRAVPAALASQASKKHNDDALLERQIRDKLEAEFDKRLEAEKESERERRAERAAILEELKKEVVAIRKEAVEQAERKARVEARDRAEQLIWERQNEEIKLKKEVEMAKAAVAAAELEAKLEAARKIAVREAEKKQEEETEMRKIKENEDRQQAEREISKRIEAEKRAYEEARAAERLKKELQQKAEAEKRERREDETRALEIARKQKEEAAFKEDIRQWAAEKAEKDRQIHFEDAMGRKYAVPFSQGRSWEGMQELINAAFIPVERLWPAVREGHYDVCRPDGTIILPQTWEEIIQPGWKILMKMWPMAPSDPQPPIAPSNTQSPTVPSNPQSQLAPLDQRPNGDTVDSEPDISVEEQRDDDTSSGYQSSSIVSWKPSRTMRIRNAFTALKNSILRKKRRRRDSWASTSSSGDASRSSSEAIND